MYNFEIEATEKTPGVIINPGQQYFEIRGNSRPENVREFYAPIIKKIDDFFLTENSSSEASSKPYEFNFRLGYFNSSTAKFISDILLKAAEYSDEGYPIAVKWHYEEGDEDMKEAGEDFSEMLSFDFDYVKHKRKN